jgi:UDP-N-acetylmuramyl pentapeptide phosphotransferase/UDP-N-acetylglucosamine-1-phosphate transferase
MSALAALHPATPAGLVLLLLCALASALLCRLALMYALRRGLLDAPGQRRSHRMPTPRGGGIAFVAVGALLALLLLPPGAATLALAGGLLAVAGIGWWDDHRPLSARLRLAVHVLAAAALVWSLRGWPGDALAAALSALALLWLVGMVNFWNFMDGINGLASLQAVLAAGLYAGLALAAGLPAEALLMLGLAAAVMGFVPFNLPRARMFMGDVGSGALGFALGAFALMLEPVLVEPWILLLPVAPMLTDACMTLLQRMLQGRRWYAAHRSHLYQWWVRRGASHVRVSLAYALFSLLVVLPSMMIALNQPGLRLPITAAVYGLAATLWLWGRARLLASVR